MANIIYAIRRDINNELPNPEGKWEELLQQSYRTRDMGVHPDYFVKGSPLHPKNLAFFVLPYYRWANQYGQGEKLAGEAIVTKESVKLFIGNIEEAFNFWYLDKLAVIPKHQHNGIGPATIRTISYVEPVMPIVARTSSRSLDQTFYMPLSDISLPVKTDMQTEDGFWYVHGFGFLNKDDKSEKIHNARIKFIRAAQNVALMPQTTLPIGSLESLIGLQ